MNLSQAFNVFELFLWTGIGIAFLCKSFNANPRSELTIIGLLFVAFGISDAVELTTGAWWRPWWLFLWKAICVGSLVAFGIDHHKRSKLRKGAKSNELPSRDETLQTD